MHRVALISTNKFKFSETFIQKHREMLPFEVHYLHGGYLPNYFGNDRKFLAGIDNPEIETQKKKELKRKLQEAISNYLKEQNIEAVLAEYGMSGVEMMDICESLNIPLIAHFHGYDAYREDMLRDYGNRYPELFKKAAAVVVVSKHMHCAIEKMGCPSEKITRNPCGVDENLFHYTDAGKQPPVFLSVGRFDETKGQRFTILAFNEVLKKNPQAKLVMLGDGHLLDSCKTLSGTLKLSGAIEFRGAQLHQAVAKQMQQSRVYLQHSVTTPSNDTEGTPVSVLEAGLSGLPVIATLHGGIPDVVKHGETGFLVHEGDFTAMADYMLQLVLDDHKVSSMGKAANEFIRQNFTLKHHIDKLASVINACLVSAKT